jgi:hypothetical protein
MSVGLAVTGRRQHNRPDANEKTALLFDPLEMSIYACLKQHIKT